MKPLVWLASYPKSGNTWFRALLANLDRNRTEPASINALGAPNFALRSQFDRVAGVDAADLTGAEIDLLRPRVYELIATSAHDSTPAFFKIHDAFLSPLNRQPLVPIDGSRGVIYLVRNPLDVCISFAAHSNWSIDVTIDHMADEAYALAGRSDRLERQLRQHLSSWSGHVLGWLGNGHLPVHLVRYEDLKARPAETLACAVEFAGLARTRAEIERAVQWSSFDGLRAQERATRFHEKPAQMPAFFRRGISGAWRQELSAAQVLRITGDHAAVMRKLGYLDEGPP